MNREYVSLNVGPAETVRSRSLWRAWNRLSRLQRSLIYILLVIVLVAGLYLLPSRNPEISITESLHYEPKRTDKENIVVKNIDENEGTFSQKHNEVIEEPNNDIIEADNQEVPGQIKPPEEKGIKFRGPQNERQQAVVKAFKHAWTGYKNYAWGHDMLKPISKQHSDWFSLGLTIVDGLDTMFIMKLEDEYNEARDWVEQHLNFDVNKDVNLFEVTIRVLGGLLSIYHLSGDSMFLDKAFDLGDRLLPAFDTESGVPYSDINLKNRRGHSPKWSPDSSTSEVTTVQLEFRDLSRCMKSSKFEDAAWRVTEHVHNLPKTEGLVPIFINAHTGDFRSYSTITLGARGDSYYEYLLKQWLQTGRSIEFLKDDFIEAMSGVQKLVARRTAKHKLLFIGELVPGGKDFRPKMDHLTCYLPGTLALGVKNGMPAEHMKLAEELLYTCYQTYAIHPTFLAPEISYFNIQEGSDNDIYVKTNDAHNLLRPEFLESLYLMYYITGNKTYQDWGWNVFQGFEKYAKVSNGYTSLGNVKSALNTKPKDMMESFFLGETLKYLYLLFSDDRGELDLDKFVINTEAHPLLIYNS